MSEPLKTKEQLIIEALQDQIDALIVEQKRLSKENYQYRKHIESLEGKLHKATEAMSAAFNY